MDSRSPVAGLGAGDAPQPYGDARDPAVVAACDPLIQPLVRAVNASGKAITVQSCEGHPFPMVELHVQTHLWPDILVGMVAAMRHRQQLVVTLVERRDVWERWRVEVVALDPKARALGRAVLAAPFGPLDEPGTEG